MLLTTSYSFRRAYSAIPDVLDAAKAKGYDVAAIADIASTWGWTEWQREAEKRDMRPVFAVTLAVSPSVAAKKPVVDYWTFVAKDSIKPLNELVTLANAQFRYQPLISYKQAMEVQGVFRITGHNAQLDEFEPNDDTFVGLSPACAKGFLRRAVDEGHKFCAMQNQRFIAPKDAGHFEMVCGRNAGGQTYPQHILSLGEWESASNWSAFPNDDTTLEALAAKRNLQEILDGSNAKLPQAGIYRLQSPKTLREMCLDGAAKRGMALDDVYRSRLNEELRVIEAKNFQDYFFVVADMMQFARANSLCGPGRGSSAGSLVCYLLGITDVDPIKYGLLFFRFIDVNRTDWPDIDSDIASDGREALFGYLKRKYGEDRFAQVGALSYYQTKNALNEICKALSIPRFELNDLETKVEGYAANDERKLHALADALDAPEGAKALRRFPELREAVSVIGKPIHHSTHAGGIVLSDRPISEVVATDKGTIQLDKAEAERRGFVKIDALGLTNLSIYAETLRNAGLPVDYLSGIPLDDQKAFDVINEGRFQGLFQFEGKALRGLCRDLTVESIADLSAISAFARPGPLSSGAAVRWVKKRNGAIPVDYPHEVLTPYLEETLGELVYQETVMLIANEVAGMDWPSVSKLRKAIGKSQGEEAMREYAEPFISGLERAGVDSETAQRFWREVLGFGAYGFNKSHSIAYALVSYWSCYLKAHFPLEFAAASLTHRGNKDAQIELLREMQQEGVGYVPVDAENSADKWRVANGKLIGPLTMIRGIGPKMVQTILSCRARGESLPDRARKLLETAKTEIDSLTPIADALKEAGLRQKPYGPCCVAAEKVQPNNDWQRNVYVAGLVTKCEVRDENEPRRIQDRLDRGQQGVMSGETRFLEIRLTDDTGTIFVKIGKKDFTSRAERIMETLEVGKTLVAVRGTVPPSIGMLLNDAIFKIGEIK